MVVVAHIPVEHQNLTAQRQQPVRILANFFVGPKGETRVAVDNT